jgi:hypothetical protein
LKTITSNTTTISTPWLNREEAARFLDISEATFQRLQKTMPCPHGGSHTCARFHAQVLTQWFKTVGES